jgi:hypothetical protein
MRADDQNQSDQFHGHPKQNECSAHRQRRQKWQGGDNNSPSREQQQKAGKFHRDPPREMAPKASGRQEKALPDNKGSSRAVRRWGLNLNPQKAKGEAVVRPIDFFYRP